MQQEASARRENDKLKATPFLSDDQPTTAKKITEPFDTRFPYLPPLAAEVRPRIQVELLATYQVHPPHLSRHLESYVQLSIHKNFENDHRTKRKAEIVEAEIKTKKGKVVVQERKRWRRHDSR